MWKNQLYTTQFPAQRQIEKNTKYLSFVYWQMVKKNAPIKYGCVNGSMLYYFYVLHFMQTYRNIYAVEVDTTHVSATSE